MPLLAQQSTVCVMYVPNWYTLAFVYSLDASKV
jgi:hypothetical protein